MNNLQINQLIIDENATVLSAMQMLDETGLKILLIAPGYSLRAVITDSDIRRFILNGGELTAPVKGAANYSPKYLGVEMRAKAKEFMVQNAIDALPLLNTKGQVDDIVFLADLGVASRQETDAPVVIMAGGLGTRLYPYTKILPKPLIPVGELPIVEHIMQRFEKAGSGRFNLVVNYKKNMIKSYFSETEHPYNINFVEEEKPLGTGGGLYLLKETIKETFFLTNCDILVEADYSDIYEFHKEQGNLITVVCAFKNVTIPYGVIELDDNGGIKTVTEKPQMNFLTNTGMYVVEPRIIQELEADVAVGFPDIMEKYRNVGEKVGVYPISENSWMDMGQLEELEDMRRRLEL